MNSLTRSIAIYGAVLSTILCFIKIVDFYRDKADISILLEGKRGALSETVPYGDKMYESINIRNKGRRPVTIDNVAIYLPDGDKISAIECFYRGPQEIGEGKNIHYMIEESLLKREGITTRDYIVCVTDAIGKKYYSHIFIVRWIKILRMKVFARRKSE